MPETDPQVPPPRPVNLRVLRWLTFALFLLFALTSESVGVIIPAVIREYHLGMTVAGSFHYATMSGIALGGALLGFLVDRIGPKSAILGGLFVFGLSCTLFAVNNRFGAFVALLFLGGLAIGLFKTAALSLIGDISTSATSHTTTMNMVEGFFGLGAIIGPAIVAYLLGAGSSWKWLYVLAACLCVVIAICTVAVPFPAHARAGQQTGTGISRRRLFLDPYTLGFAMAAMLYVGTETAIYVWMPTLLQGSGAPWPWLTAYALSLFFALRAVGRFLGAWLLKHLAWEQVMAVCATTVFLCFGVALLAPERLAVFALPLSGLFMSVIYPTINSKAISAFPRETHGAIAGILLFFTCVSAVLAPLAMGIISERSNTPLDGFKLAVVFAGAQGLLCLANMVWRPARSRLALYDEGRERG
jgi:fucose permease